MGSIRRKTHVALPRHTTNSEHTSGAMEDMSGKVQNANTHILQCQNHEHAHSSRSVQGPVQWGDGTLHMGSIRGKAHRLPDNAHSNGQHFSGAMDESSGKGSKTQAHISSGVVMDIAAFKVCHPPGANATALQAKKWSA